MTTRPAHRRGRPPGVRVVAGTVRGRRLVVPHGDKTRPTKDRVKAAVFSALDARGLLQGADVLDLFAGSGALGLESLSRGARAATFVERDPAALAALRENIERCGFAARARVEARDAFAPRPDRHDLVFVDPPYDTPDDRVDALVAAILESSRSSLVVVERPAGATLSEPSGCEIRWRRVFGDTLVVFVADARAS